MKHSFCTSWSLPWLVQKNGTVHQGFQSSSARGVQLVQIHRMLSVWSCSDATDTPAPAGVKALWLFLLPTLYNLRSIIREYGKSYYYPNVRKHIIDLLRRKPKNQGKQSSKLGGYPKYFHLTPFLVFFDTSHEMRSLPVFFFIGTNSSRCKLDKSLAFGSHSRLICLLRHITSSM